jgi:dienelactone hydrolase
LVNKFKPLAAALAAAGLLVACGGGGSDPGGTSTTDMSGNPGSLVYNPPLQVTALTAQQFTDRLNAGGTSGQTLLAVAGAPKCGVSFRYIEYGTVGGNEAAPERTNASGALMVPTGSDPACSGPRPIVLYAHGTTERSDYNIANIADSNNPAAGEASMIAAFYAAQGFIVVAPNYAGYDVSKLGYHPWLNAVQQSTEMRNALTAARKALPNIGTADSGKLFVTGYSQGGHVAMATVRAMQAAGETVTASAPMSGPYALAAFADAIFYGNVNLGSTEFLPLLTTSYQKAYGNLYRSPSDIYEPQFAAGIETLMPSTTSFSGLVAQGKLPQTALFSSTPPATGNPALDAQLAAITPPTGTGATDALFALGFGSGNLVNNTARLSSLMDAIANPDGAVPAPTTGMPAASPTNPIRIAVKKNDLRGNWAPQGPMLMCAGDGDPTVFYSINTGLMAQLWTPYVSAGLVTVLDVDSLAASSGPGTDPFYPIKAGFAQAKAQVAAQGGATAVMVNYHGTLVPPFCNAAAQGFFKKFQ